MIHTKVCCAVDVSSQIQSLKPLKAPPVLTATKHAASQESETKRLARGWGFRSPAWASESPVVEHYGGPVDTLKVTES